MEQHVFAVWDFMTLLKKLQQVVTCVTTPWLPTRSGELGRFITEVALGEETDEDGRGGYASHFELYREAMQECGAKVETIDAFTDRVRAGESPADAMTELCVFPSTQSFVNFNLELAREGSPHCVASAFFFGREKIIPEMFRQLLSELNAQGHHIERLEYYLNRHIELDGDHHGPLAQQLLAHLCADDEQKWRQAAQIAIEALEARIDLWDGILDLVQTSELIVQRPPLANGRK